MKNLERRMATKHVEVREAAGGAKTISGYGAIFNSETVIGGMFRERILPGAFRTAIESADVLSLFNHDENIPLGRTTAGTLTISEDATGLRYDVTPPASRADVLESISRGDVTGSSFGFRVAEGGDSWTKPTKAGELQLRTISKFAELRDVGPVTFPAFEATTAEARSAALATRAAATGMTPEAAEEAAELIAYSAMRGMLASLAPMLAQVTIEVDALIADETDDATETPEEEDAEEGIEAARLSVISAVAQQMCGLLYGVQQLVYDCQREDEPEVDVIVSVGTYSAQDTTTHRARLELEAIEIG